MFCSFLIPAPESALVSSEIRQMETPHDFSRAAREKSKIGPHGRMVEHSSGSCGRRSNYLLPVAGTGLSAFRRLGLGNSRLVGAGIRAAPNGLFAGLGHAD